MVKRTLDMKPQWLNLPTVQESAANTYTEGKMATPVVNQLQNGKALVMEILKIWFFISTPDPVNISDTFVSVTLLKKSMASDPLPNDVNVIARMVQEVRVIDSAATDGTLGFTFPTQPLQLDLSDGQGNGYLFGGKEIILAIKGILNSGVKACYCKILYRLVEVNATELIGIISE